MNFFLDRRNKIKQNKINAATIITAGVEVRGNIKVDDTIHVDGKVVGNISVGNTLVIGKTGVIIGNVKAKNAIINGELQGSLKCDTLEIMATGKVSKILHVKHLTVDGIIEGEIIGIESINILSHGKLRLTDTTDLLKVVDKKLNPHRS